MVYRFRMISNEVKNFVRDIEICSTQNFFDLYKAIQDNLHYDNTHIASFVITNENWEKEQEFTLFEMTDDERFSTIPMDKAELKDFIKNPRQRMLYIFDFFNERVFFIELLDSVDKIQCSGYPRVTYSKGIPPKQILIDFNYPDSTFFDEE